jgi:hypothetical protein
MENDEALDAECSDAHSPPVTALISFAMAVCPSNLPEPKLLSGVKLQAENDESLGLVQ